MSNNDELKQKKRLLLLQAKIKHQKKQQNNTLGNLSKVRQKAEQRKIFAAGMIFKEAGILESYNHDEVLAVLKSLSRKDNDNNG